MKKLILKLSVLLFISGSKVDAATLQPEEVMASFASSTGQWLQLPAVEANNCYDLDTDRRDDGAVFTVRIDLDGDGMAEFFVRTLCGTGGCEYPLFAGITGRHLGNVFGSQVWLLKRRTNGMPIIEAFSHSGAMGGSITRYEFDGAQYLATTVRELSGEQATEALYQILSKVPTWQSPETNR